MGTLYGYSTEALARRYKHLFKLPSLPVTAILYTLVTISLAALATTIQKINFVTIPFVALISFLSLLVVLTTIQLTDTTSLISMRRALAFFLVSTLTWICVSAIGLVYSALSAQQAPALSSFILGGFLALSFELVVINGVFIKRIVPSLILASVHPLTVFMIILPRGQATIFHLLVPSIGGAIITASTAYFLYRLSHPKTRHHINPLQLLRAFLKSWVTKRPDDLEDCFKLYSKKETVKTKVITFWHRQTKLILIVPGVHPGPFYPVGSYNLSETLYKKLKTKNSVPMIFHGAGGHERNLPRNEYSQQYATKVQEFASLLQAHQTAGFKGPLKRKFGATTTTTLAFGTDILTIISNAPYDSDDFDPRIVSNALGAASDHQLTLSLIDAHNSIGGESTLLQNITKEDWSTLFATLKSEKPNDFRLGYAHSSDIDFKHGDDISEAGIGVLLFQAQNFKGILVIVDSNNARVGLKEKLAGALKERGMELLELCTSDTHNLAARSLIRRGYYALGEATDVDRIVQAVSKLAAISEQRLDRCKYATADFSMELPLIGVQSLNDFASLTNAAINYTRTYLKKVIPLFIIIFGITLFY